MELLSEKTDAHSWPIMSVVFSPDGTKIVSGSSDKTIKVWDFGALEPSKRPALAKNLMCAGLPGTVTMELLSEKKNAHSWDISSVAFSPDGTKIVSGSLDKTIKVWESGAPEPSKRPFLCQI